MPEHTRFVYFHFHPLWWRMLTLALLKGLAQGYIVTAPAMLIMLLVGQEGTLVDSERRAHNRLLRFSARKHKRIHS